MSLELYFGGAEVPTWRKLLVAQGVQHVSVNYAQLRSRLPAKSPWLFSDHFPPETKIFLDSGAFGINRKRWSQLQHEEFLAEYLNFVQNNLGAISYFTECDFLARGLEWVEHQRRAWTGLPGFVPVWHEEWGAPLLRNMVEQYKDLGVPPLSDQHQNMLSGLVHRTRVRLHGLSFHHTIPSGLYTTIVSSSWISPMRYGETQVWDHNRLRRYSAEEKDKARTRYRTLYREAGFDADLICHDDSNELARYTIWAWQQLEASLAPPQRKRLIRRPIAATGDANEDSGSPRSRHPSVAIQAATSPNGSALPATITPLPVFDLKTVTSTVPSPDGAGTVEMTSQVPVMSRAGLRQCSSCSLAAVCSEFEAGASCKFSIPIEIRNRDQLVGIISSLLEMQAQRVAFGFFGEQLQGGYPDANVSAELDRWMRMALSAKEIEDNRDFLKVSIEGRAQAGILRRLFGAERAETLHQTDPVKAEGAVRRLMD